MNKKLLFWILLSSGLPILKQTQIIKFISIEDVPLYGWMMSVVGIFSGFAHLGWGDVFARSLSQKKSYFYVRNISHQFRIAFYAISVINLFVLPLFLLTSDVTLIVLLLAVLMVFLTSNYQNFNKVVRSIGLNKAFFQMIAFKHLLDIILYVAIVSLGFDISVKLVLIVEITSLSLVLISLFKRRFFRVYLFQKPSEKLRMKSTFKVGYKYAFGLFIISILSLIMVNMEKFLYFYLFTKEQYTSFVFLSLHFTILMSFNALIYNLLFKNMSALQVATIENKRKEVFKFFFLLSGALLLSMIPGFFVLKYLHELFFTQYSYTDLSFVLILVNGALVIINTFELFLTLSPHYRYVIIGKISFVILYLLVTLGYYQLNDKIEIVTALLIMTVLRIVYILASMLLFNLKVKK